MSLVCQTENEAGRLISLVEAPLRAKAEALLGAVSSTGSLIVAYSGGVDSSLLAFVARRMLGKRAVIAIAVSPSLPSSELADARRQSEQLDFDHIEIGTEEVDKEEYRQNTGNRCFFCKATLFEHLEKLKIERHISAIAYGANMDDLSDTRPGHEAARVYGVIAPLVQAELYKSEIRSLAKSWGLSSWDRPQAACLSSRFPDFVYITPERLSLVERAEEVVRSRGFRQVRVRFRQESTQGQNSADVSKANLSKADLSGAERGGADLVRLALVEVGEAELPNLFLNQSLMDELTESILSLGFARVIFDPTGYRQGKANSISAGGALG